MTANEAMNRWLRGESFAEPAPDPPSVPSPPADADVDDGEDHPMPSPGSADGGARGTGLQIGPSVNDWLRGEHFDPTDPDPGESFLTGRGLPTGLSDPRLRPGDRNRRPRR